LQGHLDAQRRVSIAEDGCADRQGLAISRSSWSAAALNLRPDIDDGDPRSQAIYR
jgi:hypothetical protein